MKHPDYCVCTCAECCIARGREWIADGERRDLAAQVDYLLGRVRELDAARDAAREEGEEPDE